MRTYCLFNDEVRVVLGMLEIMMLMSVMVLNLMITVGVFHGQVGLKTRCCCGQAV